MLRPDRIVRKSILSRYLVTTSTDETFAGLLRDADQRTIVLADVTQVAADGKQVAVVGELFIPRDAVKYMQTITA